jgi:multiple sugar transport system substrate-binding protein
MVATAQRFSELHPDVSIEWRFRSLQEFADFPIERLAETFDLLVIDHPFCGYAAAHGTLLALDEWMPAAFLQDQERHAVGKSHASYFYGGHQWALAIDAATPICAYRPDLLERAATKAPSTWEELMDLAKRGLVAVPAIPIDSLMHLFMLCGALGEDPFTRPGHVVREEIGVEALRMLRQLVSLCDPLCLTRNPIRTWELLASNEAVAYCPFAYGYSNYSRDGYADHTLKAGGLISLDTGNLCRSTLGGTGLAISSHCKERELAAAYAQFVASPACQAALYFDSGGQPGYRKAWLNQEVNRRSNNFFADTLSTLDAAYLRPRYEGYMHFQEKAGLVVHQYLKNGGSERTAFGALEDLAVASQSANYSVSQ